MPRKVVMVEVTQIEHTFPLASAYMKNYAKAHAATAADWDIRIRPFYVAVPGDRILDELVRERADVYTFSCYCWNMKRIRALLAGLRRAVPDARFVLGGPQVLSSMERYVEPGDEDVFACNGEGEITMSAWLDAFSEERPDFSQVPGLSYFRDGVMCVNPRAPQVDLDTIPSPFLECPFDDDMVFTQFLLETNRGCPFHCTFCTWGQMQDAVARFDLARLKEEIRWMARRQYMSLQLCDANFGMLERDLEIAECIAEMHREYGVPFIVIASHIKNKPRVVEISEVFRRAGINANTTSALQSMNPATLATIKRKNGSTSQFLRHQRALAERGLGSYAEFIWPLPGETVASLTRGLAELAKARIGSVICYPLMLLPNTEMSARRAEHGFSTVWEESEVQEIEWVIATKDVSEAEAQEGLWFYVAFLLLYDTRALYYTLHYVHERHGVSYEDLFFTFARALRAAPSEFGEYCRRVVAQRNPPMDGATFGILVSHVWHTDRDAFSRLMLDVFSRESFWQDPVTRALFELDLYARPFPFNTASLFRPPSVTPEGLPATSEGMRFHLTLPRAAGEWLRSQVEVGSLPAGPIERVCLDHAREQLPNVARRSVEQGAYYLQMLLENIRSVAPRFSVSDVDERRVADGSAPLGSQP